MARRLRALVENLAEGQPWDPRLSQLIDLAVTLEEAMGDSDLTPAQFDQRECCVCRQPVPIPFSTLGESPSFVVHGRCRAEFQRQVEAGEWSHILPPETVIGPGPDDDPEEEAA